MKKSYKAKISEISTLVEDIEAFCAENKIGDEILFSLNLCLDEIFTNIVEYGYRGRDGRIDVGLAVEGGKLISSVCDDAPAFNPLEDVDDPDLDASLEDRKLGGLGIFFVKKQMDEISYERKNGRNELRLTKILPC